MTASEHHGVLMTGLKPCMTAWLEVLRARLEANGFAVPLAPAFELDHPLTLAWGEPVLSLTAPGASWRESAGELAAVDRATGGVALFALVFRSAMLTSQFPGYRLGLEMLLVVSMARDDDDAQVCRVFEVAPDESVHCALSLELRSRALAWANGKLGEDDAREGLFEEALDALQP